MVILVFQIFLCILSIATNLLFIRYCKKALFFHKGCRVLLWTVIAVNILHSILILILQVTHVFKILTSVEACDVLVPPLFCFVFRMPATACFSAHVTVHLAMAIERGIATKQMSTYEKSDGRIGFIMAILSVIFALGIASYGMHKYNIEEETFYCSAATTDTINDTTTGGYLIVAMEAVILIMFGMLYIWNIKREKSASYDFCSKYQNRENLAVLRLLMPMVLLHFVIYSCFISANTIASSIRHLFDSKSAFRAYISAVYIVPVYTVCSPLLLWWIVNQHRRIRSQQLNIMSSKPTNIHDIYFSNYAEAWNR
ncbi:hypothetical protein V3C99_003992 [Haemonchus contortus]